MYQNLIISLIIIDFTVTLKHMTPIQNKSTFKMYEGVTYEAERAEQVQLVYEKRVVLIREVGIRSLEIE